ncbi:MAG TPA: FecR family protein [Candidatus Angelobacter sp.]|jgi:hypothetical protein|nr:FecR family protein [Candidatus Angelobacter sp.]
MKTRIAVQLFLLAAACSLAAAQEQNVGPTKAPFAGATVSDVKGKVSIQLPGQAFHAAIRSEVLPAETVIKTEDGHMLLRLSDGSDILVRSNTNLVLKQPEGGALRYLQVMFGRVRAEIQKRLGGAPGFQIGTPSAVISVRGTIFEVEVSRGGLTEVDVREGLVQFDSVNGGSVMIRAGFSSRVGMSGSPETPRPTRDMRPDLDRPGRHDGRGDDHDAESIKKLRAGNDDHHDHDSGDSNRDSGSKGDSSGGSGSTSGGSGSGSGDNEPDHSGDHGSDHGDHSGGKPPADQTMS